MERRPHARTALALLAPVLLLAALPAHGEEEAGPTVSGLHFRGIEHLSAGELSRRILTRGPDWRFWRAAPPFEEAVLEEDVERIGAVYAEHGFYDARATVDLAWNEDHSEVDVTFEVVEGEPVRLAGATIEPIGAHRLPPEDWDRVVSDLPLREGEIFGTTDYRAARQALLDRLAELGRAAPRLEGGARIDVEAREARVDWRVDVGPLVRFGEITVRGLERVDPSIVRRELLFATGEPYSLRVQRASQVEVYALGLFRSVTIEPVVPAPPAEAGATANEAAGTAAAEPEVVSWPMVVRVSERPPRTLRLGAGYGTDEGPRGRVELVYRNFLGAARRLSLTGRASAIEQGFDARLLQPHFLAPGVRLEVDGVLLRETVPAYDATRVSTSLMLFHRLTPTWEVRGGYGFEFADESATAFAPLRPEQDVRVSEIPFGLQRSTLDDTISPERGTWLDLSTTPAFEALGSSASFAPVVGELRGFHKLGPVVLAGRVKYGTITPFAGSGDDDVPAIRRFYAGGSTSVRGYGYQKIGPTDASGDPTGGLSLAEASVEVRFPIWWILRGAAFVDAGNVMLSPSSFDASTIQYGAGAGLRLETPVGPVRLDLGFPINPRPGIDDPVQVHLAVGQAF